MWYSCFHHVLVAARSPGFFLLWLILSPLFGRLYAYYTNMPASVVIGQRDFTSVSINQGGAPGANTLRNPHGVFSDGTRLLIPDPNNRRVLIYNSIPTTNNAPADVVIGQPNFTSVSNNQGGAPGANTLSYVNGVYFDGTNLFISEWSNNRILVYHGIPTTNNAPADVVIGQPNFTSNSANQGGTPTANTLRNPVGMWSDGTRLVVADSDNHRVLIYNAIPTTNNAPADVVIGQPNFTSNSANQGGTPAANTLRNPVGVVMLGAQLVVSEDHNHRVLIYNTIPTTNNTAADVVIGQPSFTSNSANQGGTANATTLNRPQGIATDGKRLVVVDSENHRVLIYNSIPTTNNAPADVVIGQPNFTSNSANQGGSPRANTLSWLNGVFVQGDRMFVSDYINNRVLIFPNSFPLSGLSHSMSGQPEGKLRFSGTAQTSVTNQIIKYLEYSVNGSSWTGVQAQDGSFDSAQEGYFFDFDPSHQNPDKNDGFTVRVRVTHNNDIDTGSKTLYFEPFTINNPEDKSYSHTLAPSFSFSINSWRFSDLRENLDRFRIMVQKDGQEWTSYLDYIPVEYEAVRERSDNVRKSVVKTTGNGIYEDKYKMVTYSNNNATITVSAKAVDSVGNPSDKYRENGGSLLSPGIYQWKVQAIDRSGHIQETRTRTLAIQATFSAVPKSIYFPVALLSVTGMGNSILSTDYPQGIKPKYSTWSTNPTFYGLAWVNATIALSLTQKSCQSDCTKTFTTTVNPESRFGITLPSNTLRSGSTYTVNLSAVYGDYLNTLPQFQLSIR